MTAQAFLARALLAAGLCGMVAAATFAGAEATLVSLLIAAVLLAIVLARPQVGVLLLVTNFLIASYPTALRGDGLLTINNILGIVLSVVLAAQLAYRPDFSFLKERQVQMYIVIGVAFALGTILSYYQFPDLRVTYGTGGKTGRIRSLDQTAMMLQLLVTRFAFVILALHFLRRERDVVRAVALFMGCLIMVVPSALYGYATASDPENYRAAASFSAGTNANRLAYICLVQIAFWWYFAIWYFQRQGKKIQRVAVYGIIISLIFTTLLTASRSGALGLGIVFLLLVRSRDGGAVSRVQVVLLAFVAIGILLTAIPEGSLERIQNIDPTATKKGGGAGSYSTERRVATVETGWRMFLDYPVFGVGIGNFRAVAQQVYFDPFYRPPHNSYIWALSEGGIVIAMLYGLLFWFTWKDILWIRDCAATPEKLRWVARSLQAALVLTLFFSAFADIWLNAILYILVIIVLIIKRYVKDLALRVVAAA